MPTRLSRTLSRSLSMLVLACAALALAGCITGGTKLQPPTAGIQQLTVQPNGTWTAVVRFQNYSYDTGMHVYAIDAMFTLNGKPAGHIAISPALDIPEMDADIATATFKPDAAGAAALVAAKSNAIAYALKGTLSVGKGTQGTAQPFKLDGKGYLSPVPGVADTWR